LGSAFGSALGSAFGSLPLAREKTVVAAHISSSGGRRLGKGINTSNHLLTQARGKCNSFTQAFTQEFFKT
jgi:hypothetical protein